MDWLNDILAYTTIDAEAVEEIYKIYRELSKKYESEYLHVACDETVPGTEFLVHLKTNMEIIKNELKKNQ